jgi:hypothetical protein
MSETIVRFVKVNNTWGQILTDDYGVLESLYKRFSVPVENYWFMPAFKAGRWDGKIHFVSQDGRFYNGLLNRVLNYFKDDNSFKLIMDQEYKKEFSDIDALKKDFLDVTNKTLTVVDPYIYQIRGALKAIYQMNAICEHATGSGKSYTICMVANYLLQKNPKHKILVLVPKLDLIEQLTENFVTFGVPKEMIGKFCGYQKDEEQAIIVSTWQSVYTKPKFLRNFSVLVCDECLHPSSNITMGDGSEKKISEVVVGDLVKTINESTGLIENKPIMKIHHNLSRGNQMYKLTLDNGIDVKITGNHKVKLKDGTWKMVANLNVDDDIIEI